MSKSKRSASSARWQLGGKVVARSRAKVKAKTKARVRRKVVVEMDPEFDSEMPVTRIGVVSGRGVRVLRVVGKVEYRRMPSGLVVKHGRAVVTSGETNPQTVASIRSAPPGPVVVLEEPNEKPKSMMQIFQEEGEPVTGVFRG